MSTNEKRLPMETGGASENPKAAGSYTPNYSTNGASAPAPPARNAHIQTITADRNGNGLGAEATKPMPPSFGIAAVKAAPVVLPVTEQIRLLAATFQGQPFTASPLQFSGPHQHLAYALHYGQTAQDLAQHPDLAPLLRDLFGVDLNQPPEYKYPVRSAAFIKSLPGVNWIVGHNDDRTIARVLAAKSLAMIYGPSGQGKTWAALGLSWAIATGTEWQGIPTQQGVVLYGCFEGDIGLGDRIRALEEHHEQECPDALVFLTEPVQFFDNGESNVAQLVAELAAQGITVSAIVIDTYTRATAGHTENDVKETGIVIANMDRLVKATGAAVIAIHHAGKNGDYRGSSNLLASVDTLIEVTQAAGTRTVTIKSEKSKHSDNFKEIKTQRIDVGPGCVLIPADSASEAVGMTGHPLVILRYLYLHQGEGETRANLRQYCTNASHGIKGQARMSEDAFNKAMGLLWGPDQRAPGEYIHNETKLKKTLDPKASNYRSRFHITDAGKAIVDAAGEDG